LLIKSNKDFKIAVCLVPFQTTCIRESPGRDVLGTGLMDFPRIASMNPSSSLGAYQQNSEFFKVKCVSPAMMFVVFATWQILTACCKLLTVARISLTAGYGLQLKARQ
jgi:hypothetical protein